jgi:hypothetical protein
MTLDAPSNQITCGWMRIRAFTVTGRRIVLAADSPAT